MQQQTLAEVTFEPYRYGVAQTWHTAGGPTQHTPRRPVRRLGCTKKAAGQEATLCFVGPVLMENRKGLVMQATMTPAIGTAERDAALALVDAYAPTRRITLGGDTNDDTHQFVQDLRARQVTPHVAQHTTNWASAIDGRTTRHPGYIVSRHKRKRVEEVFSWMKAVGLLHKVKLRGVPQSAGSSPSRRRCITWCGCAHWWRLEHEPPDACG